MYEPGERGDCALRLKIFGQTRFFFKFSHALFGQEEVTHFNYSSSFTTKKQQVKAKKIFTLNLCDRRRCCLEGHPPRSVTKMIGPEGSSFYYLRMLYCMDQMQAVMLLSQHRVSSSKTVRPCATCVARYMGHATRTWFAVCSVASYSQFGEGARTHLCMGKLNRPTLIRKQLTLTPAARSKPIPTGLVPVMGMKVRSLDLLLQYSVFHL